MTERFEGADGNEASNNQREPRRPGRRWWDDLYYWMPILLSLVITILSLGVTYGTLTGRLSLIEYRLLNIEQRIPNAPFVIAPAPPPPK